MLQMFGAHNHVDEKGFPAGGNVAAKGLEVTWQNGPLGRGDDRAEPNGAFVETLIAVAKQRIEFYQEVADGKFKCTENQIAIMHLEAALETLDARTQRRETAGVEGTHAGS